MLENIKILLGEAAANYTEPEMLLAYQMAAAYIENYCRRELTPDLELLAVRIAVLNLLKRETDGLTGHSYSGMTENFIDGLPADIQMVLNNKRRIKTH